MHSVSLKFLVGILSFSDYYPFGMQMPGRNGDEDYRYAFNGMEQDPEVSGDGNSYTTEFRAYDPRLGRWKSLDPLMSKFAHSSPYVGFANNPIVFTDPYGLEPSGGGLSDALS
jgi:RHS repeat-associated protein